MYQCHSKLLLINTYILSVWTNMKINTLHSGEPCFGAFLIQNICLFRWYVILVRGMGYVENTEYCYPLYKDQRWNAWTSISKARVIYVKQSSLRYIPMKCTLRIFKYNKEDNSGFTETVVRLNLSYISNSFGFNV